MQNPSVFLYAPQVAKIEDSSYPDIKDQHDVIIRIAYVGVCGSDVHFWTQGGIIAKVDPSRPLIMGHEASGTIHEVGSAVSSLKVGDRVAIEPGYPCRRCTTCKAGRYNFCPGMTFAASPPYSHGMLTKYKSMPEDFCYKLPDFLGLDEAVIVEPLAVAVHVCRLADIRIGQNVVVFGAGTVGLLCASVSKAMGAGKIISVDIDTRRLEFAQRFAANGIFQPSKNATSEEIAKAIQEMYDLDEGADTVLEATGAETCIEAGIHVLKKGGTFIQAGLGKPKIQFSIATLSEKEINMKGCFRYNAGDFDLAMHLLGERKVSVKELISSIEPFERTTEQWEKTRRGDGIKNLVRGPQD